MQAHRAPAHAVARDKLDLGRVGPGNAVATHLQAQPLRAGLEIQRRRAVRRMPGGQEVAGPLPIAFPVIVTLCGPSRTASSMTVSVNGALEGTDLASAIVLSVHTPTH